MAKNKVSCAFSALRMKAYLRACSHSVVTGGFPHWLKTPAFTRAHENNGFLGGAVQWVSVKYRHVAIYRSTQEGTAWHCAAVQRRK